MEDYVVETMLKATTLTECQEADALAEEYLRRYPDSMRVLRAGEQLTMMATAHEYLKKRG